MSYKRTCSYINIYNDICIYICFLIYMFSNIYIYIHRVFVRNWSFCTYIKTNNINLEILQRRKYSKTVTLYFIRLNILNYISASK